MPIDDESADAVSPIGELLEALTAFLDEVAEEQPDGFARVDRMRITMPVEFYVRPDAGAAGRVAAIESRPPDRTRTSVMPVLHGLTLEVEVDSAGQRQPGVES